MSSPEIIDCEQGSERWIAARLGLPTASEFHSILAKGEGKTRRSYLYKLAGELITGTPMENYANAHMDRGKALEPEARDEYEFMTGNAPQIVGFVRNHGAGCSPDSLIGDDGALEIKTKLPAILIDVILRGKLPSEHVAQCQGALWICERQWIDFAAYWPGLPLFVVRVERDEDYIKTLAEEVAAFRQELAGVVERVRAYQAYRAAA